VNFEQFRVVVVPFPFTDVFLTKRRPAVIVSRPNALHADRSVFAMITSSYQDTWPLDMEIYDLNAAGLNTKCYVRSKFFTLDHSLIVRSLGLLSKQDAKKLEKLMLKIFFG